MPQFYLHFDGISPSPPKKRSSRKNATDLSGFWCDFQNKTKKGLPSSAYWFLSVISMGPLKPMGPLLGPLKPTGPMMGPLKSMGPGVVVSLPPSRRPCRQTMSSRPKEFGDPNLVLRGSGCGPRSAFIDLKVCVWTAVRQLSSHAQGLWEGVQGVHRTRA